MPVSFSATQILPGTKLTAFVEEEVVAAVRIHNQKYY